MDYESVFDYPVEDGHWKTVRSLYEDTAEQRGELMGFEKSMSETCCGDNPMEAALSDSGMLDLAHEVAQKVLDSVKDERIAESSRVLFIACAALLRDWFNDRYFNPCGMVSLLSLALDRSKYDSTIGFETRKTALDLIFEQIKHGVKYVRNERGEWEWKQTSFARKYDGARPGCMEGMPNGSDIAASFYTLWQQSDSPDVLEESIYACIGEVAMLGVKPS